jgi:flagellar motor switch protein FliN
MVDTAEISNAVGGEFVSQNPETNIDLLSGVCLRVSVEVGSASIRLSDLLNLGEGSIVELDRQSNDLLDVFANGTLIAKGEIVTVEGRYGIRIAEVVSPDQRSSGIERRA